MYYLKLILLLTIIVSVSAVILIGLLVVREDEENEHD